MKKIFTLIALCLSLAAVAGLSEPQQLVVVEKIAKEHRRQMHIENFDDVESYVEKVTKARLNELMKNNSEVEAPLDSDQVASLQACMKRSKTCSLFLISLTGSWYGGDVRTHSYVLLNPETGKTEEIMHEVYAE